MLDVVLDSSVIGDFLGQFFSSEVAARGERDFISQGAISIDVARELNRIVDRFRRFDLGLAVEEPHSGGLVVASALAFVELSRKWEEMVAERFSVVQLEAFIAQSPEWFSLAPVDDALIPFYVDVPAHVVIHGRVAGIEWCDAIHVATVLSRGATSVLVTTDERLRAIEFLRNRVLP